MKNKKKNKVVSVISTIIYVVLLALLLFTLFMNLNKKENEISSFLGYSFAVVQSGSMIDGGFDIGDMVVIKKVDTDTLRKGDIIVFYKYSDPSYQPTKNDLQNNNITDLVGTEGYVEENKDTSELNLHTMEDAIDAPDSKLIFHRIIAIYVDEYGMRFYETQGDSNNSADSTLVREDFICAKYVETGKGLQAFLDFVTSPVGLVVVIILPVIAIMCVEFLACGKEVKTNLEVEKLLTRKKRYTDIDTKKYKIAEFITDEEKVYLYDISAQEDRENLAIILWDTDVQNILDLRIKNREEYYQEFEKIMSAQSVKKLKLLKIKADIILANPTIEDDVATKQAKEIWKEHKEKDNATGNRG